MSDKLQSQLSQMGDRIIGFLPNLLAGMVLLVTGWLLGWLAKRIVVQLLVVFRLERLLIRFRWGKDFSRADVRYGLYNSLGNIAFLIIFLIFLDDALNAWKLTFLSSILERAILLFPRVFVSMTIFGVGWLIASWAGGAVRKALRRENIPGATLISRFAKASLILLFSAMALIELNVARQIVIIGFSTIFITLGALTVVMAAVGGKELLKGIQQTLEDE